MLVIKLVHCSLDLIVIYPLVFLHRGFLFFGLHGGLFFRLEKGIYGSEPPRRDLPYSAFN